MENASSVSISVAGTSPQSQDAGRRGQTLHTSTGAMVAAHARGVGHCSAVSPDGAATCPGVWGGCGGHQGCTAHCWLPPLSAPVCPVAGGQQGPVAPFSSPTAGMCALGTPGLLSSGKKHSPKGLWGPHQSGNTWCVLGEPSRERQRE